MPELLYEIRTEEIPAGYIAQALKQLEAGLRRRLEENRLAAGDVKAGGTPRRLVLWADGIPEEQGTLTERVAGPPAHVAFDGENKPTRAAEGFARSLGIDLERLKVEDTGKGPYVVALLEHPGKPAMNILPDLLAELAREIRFPKSMRWPVPEDGPGKETPMQFARPVRGIAAIFGEKTVPVSVAGLRAESSTCGHPFLRPGPIPLRTASWKEYIDKLRDAFVIVDMRERGEKIAEQIKALASASEPVDMDGELLDEVTGLVEYPHVLSGRFDESFLCMPDCVLAAAMTQHQRYFPVRDARGRMLNRFVIVSNRTAKQEKTVREGNQRVLGARLADARFFWDEDRKTPLVERVAGLEDVVYLGGLGNNLQRTRRLEKLSGKIAVMAGADGDCLEHVREAASLCKADLTGELVGEFPSLQGKVGGELALQEGRPEPVALAIAEHYLPASAGDPAPRSTAGAVLSLADKMDAIICCCAMGYIPDGSQDPFAMRRNAIGVARILEEKELDLQVGILMQAAGETLLDQSDELGRDDLDADVDSGLRFFRDRLYHEALDRGYRHDMVRAVLAAGFDRPAADECLNNNVSRFWKRLKALCKCADSALWPELVEVVDRTYRIQQDMDQLADIDGSLLREDAEKALNELLNEHGEDIRSLFTAGHFTDAALKYCEIFAAPVHRFFEEVFVNVEDDALRRARKSLCGHIYRLFAGYLADLYMIESPDKDAETS